MSNSKALAIIVSEDGDVENRILDLPPGLPTSTLNEARNYLNARMSGRTLQEAREVIRTELKENRAQLDALAARLIEDGFAQWTGEDPLRRAIIDRSRTSAVNR